MATKFKTFSQWLEAMNDGSIDPRIAAAIAPEDKDVIDNYNKAVKVVGNTVDKDKLKSNVKDITDLKKNKNKMKTPNISTVNSNEK